MTRHATVAFAVVPVYPHGQIITQPAALSRRGLCAIADDLTAEAEARLAAADARRAQRRLRRLRADVRGQGGVA